jgi:AcrR family transcriptional regulator
MTSTAQEVVELRRSRGRPKLEEIAVLESKLLAIALKEFLAHGYGATSIARIVKAAGISKTTLYSRFPSKERLFRAIMREQINRLATATGQLFRANKPELEVGLKAYANQMLELSLQGDLLEVNRLIYGEALRFPELGAAAAERTEMGIRRISKFIRECAFADGIPCKDPEAAAEAFIHMIRGWYVNVMLTNRKVRAARREKWVDRAVSALLSARSDW